MLDIYPDYYEGFACLAGSCPDTCCAQWEVVVDDETAALYAGVPGPLGEKLRRAMTTDEDGDRILQHENGRCPLLTEELLCGVQLALGHEALCRTCRVFPRLCQDYTLFREHSLSLSCPEAARRILLAPRLPILETRGEPEDGDVEYDQADLDLLRTVRAEMFRILGDTARPISERIALCLALGEHAQAEMDGEEPQPFSPKEALARFRAQKAPADWTGVLAFYRDLEILTPEWAELLEDALAHPRSPDPAPDPFLASPQEFANLMFDGLYRNLFCAVADFDLLPRVQAAVLSCALGRFLIDLRGGDVETRLRIHQLYAKEVEHCVQNKDALLDACYDRPFFSVESIFSMLL